MGGRYELRQPLGEGTFAVTYLAEDLVLGRLVAVKLLRARYGNDPAAAARFEREARAAAAVSSPYIVDVFDYGIDQGTSYIVLQYVEGPTLRQQLDRVGRLEPREAVRLAIEVLRGLDVIHRAGIVHRDVKPQNVLLDRHGTARVSDFGVALWAGSETLTSRGLAVGTAAYMAPEQARATDVGEGADLYAVGVLLFEMLTGTVPFQADHPTALMLAHVQRQPPLPSEALPGLAIPAALEREVMRALAKDAADRRRSAKEMADALEAAVAGIGPGVIHPAASNQISTTASMPAFTGPSTPGTRADTRAVGPRRAGGWPIRARAWLLPLGLVLGALVVLMAIAMRGGFSGLAGRPNDTDGNRIIGVVEPSPTPGEAVDLLPAATVAPEAPGGGQFSTVQEDAATIAPAPTIAVAAPAETAVPTAPPAPTATATVVPEPASTEAPAAVDPAVSEEQRERRQDRRDRQQDEERGPEPNPDSIAPNPAAASADGSAVQFSAGDWQGAAPVDAGSFGRPAVAMYGAEGPSARAALQFTLSQPPAGDMVLTVSGLGDETGLPFQFGIEVNGEFVGQSTRTFDNWRPARDGANGENATWSQMRLRLPPEVFQVGLNEIALISMQPGDYEDRPPYMLLSEAALAPRE